MRVPKLSKIFAGLIIISIILFLNPASAVDQSDTAGITMQVPSLCKLTINDSDQVMDLLQDASGEEAYEAGYIQGELNKPSLVVSSNTGWKLSVAVSIGWDIVDGYQKEIGDLMLKVSTNSGHQTGFSNYSPLSLTDQEIASHTRGSGHAVYNCNYRIKLDWDKDIPGIYVIIISYTLSTQPF